MKVEVTIKCSECGKNTSILVSKKAYDKYERENLKVQDAFPTLSVKDREVLISTLCHDCQDKVFVSDDEADPYLDDLYQSYYEDNQ